MIIDNSWNSIGQMEVIERYFIEAFIYTRHSILKQELVQQLFFIDIAKSSLTSLLRMLIASSWEYEISH